MKLPGILKEMGDAADREGINAFVVGGFVRDALLGIADKDIDIVIEANAINFSRTLGKAWGTGVAIHEGFKTATIKRAGFRIDFATARKERYRKPAALPEITAATIKEDLLRRDFTINAMAVCLNKNDFGGLIDFYNGQKDLASKRIRVLHDRSFIDDPTRILRAVRFEQRLGFAIEPDTLKLIGDALRLDMLGRLKKQRLAKEMNLILDEPNSAKMIRRIRGLGISVKK
jgi:tRNA nucleotidyltransferase (CCA-adding enzyme)